MFKRRIKQYILFWSYTIFALVVPLILVAEKFGFLTTKPEATSLMFGGVISLIVALFYFRKHLRQGIDNLPNTTVKYLLQGIRELMPLLIMYISFGLIQLQMENIVFIMKWSAISNAGALWLRTLHLQEVVRVQEIEKKLEEDKEDEEE